MRRRPAGSADLCVTEEAPYHFQLGTAGDQQGREGVAEVVDADVGDLGDHLHVWPEPLGICKGDPKRATEACGPVEFGEIEEETDEEEETE